jgi:hypothetical protein
MVAQGFALDDFVGVIVFERQRIFGVRAFVLDGFDFGERSFHFLVFWRMFFYFVMFPNYLASGFFGEKDAGG